ncbi:MAG: sigma-70 family RNA polymerase sigma factor [Bryobacteraceae bacterium]
MPETSPDITQLLDEAARGDGDAAERVFQAVYAELRKLAGAAMRGERPGHTLQPTALVHEAYMRLIPRMSLRWESRAHFLNAAARVMRRILIDHARSAQAAKRPSPGRRAELGEHAAIEPGQPDTMIAIDEALGRLEAMDSRQGRIVELRFFGGLSVEETARLLNVSEKTVKRDWALARAWLEGELRA